MEKLHVRKSKYTGGDLMDVVFSWSLNDVFNEKLCAEKVRPIPLKFTWRNHYMESFIGPLIEETRADLMLSLRTMSLSGRSELWESSTGAGPARELLSFQKSSQYKLPKNLFYDISLKSAEDIENDTQIYEPQSGDIIALTDRIPIFRIEDPNKSESTYNIALVEGSCGKTLNKFRIKLSKPMCFEQDMQNGDHRKPLFAVYLINMTTNSRIWNALHWSPERFNTGIIQEVLQTDPSAEKGCILCCSNSEASGSQSDLEDSIDSFDLNPSQKAAVFSCIATAKCHHKHSVKLIKGPPGTGKTKTVGSILFGLLKMKCRTLACAPTNTAVLQIAARLLNFVEGSLGNDTYGLGDILLFGNSRGMEIDGDLLDVFLDFRAEILAKCFAQRSGWKHCLESMIYFLEKLEENHNSDLKNRKEHDKEDMVDKADKEKRGKGILIYEKQEINKKRDVVEHFKGMKGKQVWKAVDETSKANQSKEIGKLNRKKEEDKDELTQIKDNEGVSVGECDVSFISHEFVERFDLIHDQLKVYTVNLYTHLPTSIISLEVVETMVRALDLLKRLSNLFHTGGLKADANKIDAKRRSVGHFPEFHWTREECLKTLRCLGKILRIPTFSNDYKIKKLCLSNAYLLFCTASSSYKLLQMREIKSLELLVIDEAAQLKECESTIPLQIHGLRHAILVGDEMQISALVKSKILEDVEFDRSLFERLVLLGHQNHLLNVQYRMHPSISLFPNREFYNSAIIDAPTVKEDSYNKHFLDGKMYGPFSFINVASGVQELNNFESQNKKKSSRNMVEVAVVSEIIASLFKETKARKQKVCVGVISPYKAQVLEIKKNLGEAYNSDAESDFSIKVSTIDGFQGDEEDIIIISTVRCNRKGSIGFLKSRKRANVSLTRARHCLWILGNARTLENSVWGKLVENAKGRGCFYNAYEETKLAKPIMMCFLEHSEVADLQNMAGQLFRNTRWKVFFSDKFWNSMANIFDSEIHEEVLSLIEKLSSGCGPTKRNLHSIHGTHLVKSNISRQFHLLWSVDIVEENSYYIQVLKIYDIVSFRGTARAVRDLCASFEEFAQDYINRCKIELVDGEIGVPMKWAMHSECCLMEVSNSFGAQGPED